MGKVRVTRKEYLWEPLKPGNFGFWLQNAREGDRLIYHVGNLMADRVVLIEHPTWVETRFIEPLNEVAAEVWQAYEQGLVTLSQKRIGENLFQYVARCKRRMNKLRSVV